MGAEHDVAILAAFAVLDMEHHARSVDVGHLEVGQLGAAHACAIEGDENGAVEGNGRGVDQAGDLFRAPDDRQVNALLRVGHFVAGPGPLQGLEEKEAQCTDHLVYCVVGELPITE